MPGNIMTPGGSAAGFALVLVLCSVPALPGTAGAQEGWDLDPGTRVRLTVIEVAWRGPIVLTGTAQRLTDDTLYLRTDGEADPRAVPLGAIERVELSAGRSSSPGRGALFGGLTGLAGGAIAGFASGDDDPGILSFSAEEKALMGGVLGAAIGAGVGAIIGSTVKREPWESQPGRRLDVAVAVRPAPAGFGLGVRGTLRM